jgi:hypothetical protein
MPGLMTSSFPPGMANDREMTTLDLTDTITLAPGAVMAAGSMAKLLGVDRGAARAATPCPQQAMGYLQE